MRLAILLAALLPIATAASADPTTIDVGMIIGNNQGQVINGWVDNGGGFYVPLGSSDRKCCFSQFERDGQYLTAISEPVAKSSTGGTIAERVVAVKVDRLAAGEEERSICGPMSYLDPLRSFFTPKTRAVRSIFYDGTAFQELRWIDTDGRCDLPD